jgi:IclR family acetate operon transcriptional repressor
VVTKAVDTRHSMYPLRAVDRVCDIIDLLTQHPSGITLSALAAEVELPKSSAFRYLAALEIRGYVARSDDGIGYRLGAPIPGTEPLTNGRLERLITAAKPLMSRLTSSDAPVCLLATLDGDGIRYLWVSASAPIDPRVPQIGDRGMLHNNAAGKAIAAQLTDDAVLRTISVTGMPRPTASTLGSPTGLLRELHRVRGEGFAISENERHSAVRGVAVPIGGETLALSLAGREDQLTPDRVGGAVRQLRRAAVVLARELRG